MRERPLMEDVARVGLKYLPRKRATIPLLQKVGRYDRSVAMYYTALNRLFITMSAGNNNLHNAYYLADDETYADGQDNLSRLVGDALGLDAAAHLLDVGCGLGGPAGALADWYGCRVTGVNITPAQVRAARSYVAGRGVADRVDFLVADATAMELPPAGFTHAMALASFSHMPDKPGVLGRVARALRPGGAMAVNDLSVPDLGELERHPDYEFFAFMLGFPPEYLCTDDEMASLLDEAGFGDQEVTDLTSRSFANPDATADWVRACEPEVTRLYGRDLYQLSLELVTVLHTLTGEGLIREQLWVGRLRDAA